MASAAKHAPKPPYRRPPRTAPQEAVDASEGGVHLSLNHVEGRLKAKTVKKIGDLVEGHPEETLSILRNWLHAATGRNT